MDLLAGPPDLLMVKAYGPTYWTSDLFVWVDEGQIGGWERSLVHMDRTRSGKHKADGIINPSYHCGN